MSKFCIYCGTSIAENDKFCPKCGKKLQQEDTIVKEVIPLASSQTEDIPIAQSEVASVDTDVTTEKTPTESVQIPASGTPVPEKKAKKNSKAIIGIFCAVAVVLIIAIIAMLPGKEPQNNDNNPTQTTEGNGTSSHIIPETTISLPVLSEFETLMTNAVIDFYDEAGIDAVAKGYLLKDYEVSDMSGTEAVYEYMISCTYGPNKTIGLMGTANDGKVEYVFTYIPLIGMEVDGDSLAAMAPMVMVPAGLYDDEYSNVEGLYGLMEKLIQTGTRDEEGDSATLIIDDIEYTLTVSNSMLGFTVNARNESSTSNTTPNNSQNDNSGTSYTGNWKADYADVLDNVMIEFPNYQYSCNYVIYDIDENGVPEMFVKVGTCEADYEYRVFTMSDEALGVVLIDTLPAGHASICGIQTKGAFLLWGGHQGYEWISKVTLKNNSFTEERIFDAEVVNYHELESLIAYEVNDRTGLNWSTNPSDNNQQSLDNYSMDDNVIPEPDITSDNFEQVVPLTKRSDWYDNGIFSSYFDSCDHQSGVTWQYIGTTPDIFGLSYYDYSDVDVYRVDYTDGWVSYLFVPYNENIGNPPVVFLFFDSNEAPWEIWNGNS